MSNKYFSSVVDTDPF